MEAAEQASLGQRKVSHFVRPVVESSRVMLLPVGSAVKLKGKTKEEIHSVLWQLSGRRWRSSRWTPEERCSTAQNEPQAERLGKPGEEIQTVGPIESEKKAKFTFFFST